MALSSVIQIPVDDSEFTKFAEAFSEYQTKLKDMPADWQAVNLKIVELAKVQRALGVSADRAWATATTAALGYERAVKRAESAQAHLGRTTISAAHAMGRMASHVKGISSGIFGVVRSLANIATFGIAGSILGAAGGLFGFDALAHSVMGQQRTARGLGLNVGQYNAFRTYMAPYTGTGVLSGAAHAKMNLPDAAPYLSLLGISAAQAQQDTAAQLADQVMLATRKAYRANPTMFGIMPQSEAARYFGLSSEDVYNIGTANGADLRRRMKEAVTNTAGFGFTAKVAEDWTKLSVALTKAKTNIEAAFITALAPIAPELAKLSKEAASFIVGLEKSGEVKQWVADLADGIKQFAAWLGSPSFQQDMRTMAYYFHAIASGVGSVARFIVGPMPASPGENNFLNAKTIKGTWAGYKTKGAAEAAYINRLTYGSAYQNQTMAQQIATWNGHGANSVSYAQNVALWAGQMLGLGHPLALNKAFSQYDAVEQAAILSAMSREEKGAKHQIPMGQLLPVAEHEWWRDHPHGGALLPYPPAPEGPRSFGRGVEPAAAGGAYTAPARPSSGASKVPAWPTAMPPSKPSASGIGLVRDRYWKTRHPVHVKVLNNTSAQVHVSANAASAS